MSTARDATAGRSQRLPLSARLILERLSGLRSGRIDVQLPQHGAGFHISGAAPGLHASLHVHAPWRLLFRGLSRGTLGFGESFVAGEWTSPELRSLLTLLAANEDALGEHTNASVPARIGLAAHHRLRANTRRGSRRNIATHYDLGNAFYRLWLDSSMTYSGAVFESPEQTLEAAQQAKYEQLLDALGVRPGQHVLEIGCGWGGFVQAAARRGVNVTGITLSHEQLSFARERLRRAGLERLAELRFQDYRDIRSDYDHIVSIEMLEAVGERFWPVYFETLARRVRPGGRIALHGITIDAAQFAAYRAEPDFIQRYVFPGGMLPTEQHLLDNACASGLEALEVERLGVHYAVTLAHWYQRFEHALDEVRALGYDERFIRLWRYYLAYCEAGFRSRRIDLQRLVLSRPA